MITNNVRTSWIDNKRLLFPSKALVPLVSAALTGASLLGACHERYFSCYDENSCGESAGAAGEPGQATGGSAGVGGGENVAGKAGAPSKSCRTDAECDDKQACNGAERCETGACAAGTSACANPDPANCERPCTESASGPVCGKVEGQDKDNDKHRSAACKEAPGDDCDDSRDDTFKGATELCDGVDNDCDGLMELADGFELSGNSHWLGDRATGGSIAWSPKDGVYGVILSAGAAGALQYYAFKPTDELANGPVDIDTSKETRGNPVGYSTGIGWGGDDFGIAYWADRLHFRRISATGSTTQDAIEVADSLYPQQIGVARAGAGHWGIVWHDSYTGYDEVKARTVSASGTLSAQLSFGNPASDVRIIPSGDTLGLVWTSEPKSGGKFVDWTRRSALFAELEKKTLSSGTTSDNPVIAAMQGGYGVAWLDGADLVFQQFNANGSVICGPEKVVASGFVPDDMVGTSRGFLMVSGRSRIEALEISKDCHFGQRFTIDGSSINESENKRVHIASGEKGFGVLWNLWDGSDGNKERVVVRVFGPNYCD